MKAKDGSKISTFLHKNELDISKTFKGHTQPKLDGWRIMADLHNGTLHTRGGKVCTLI